MFNALFFREITQNGGQSWLKTVFFVKKTRLWRKKFYTEAVELFSINRASPTWGQYIKKLINYSRKSLKITSF